MLICLLIKLSDTLYTRSPLDSEFNCTSAKGPFIQSANVTASAVCRPGYL